MGNREFKSVPQQGHVELPRRTQRTVYDLLEIFLNFFRFELRNLDQAGSLDFDRRTENRRSYTVPSFFLMVTGGDKVPT
jgi:hypothetical protein